MCSSSAGMSITQWPRFMRRLIGYMIMLTTPSGTSTSHEHAREGPNEAITNRYARIIICKVRVCVKDS